VFFRTLHPLSSLGKLIKLLVGFSDSFSAEQGYKRILRAATFLLHGILKAIFLLSP
jgi:hypothetical protein